MWAGDTESDTVRMRRSVLEAGFKGDIPRAPSAPWAMGECMYALSAGRATSPAEPTAAAA